VKSLSAVVAALLALTLWSDGVRAGTDRGETTDEVVRRLEAEVARLRAEQARVKDLETEVGRLRGVEERVRQLEAELRHLRATTRPTETHTSAPAYTGRSGSVFCGTDTGISRQVGLSGAADSRLQSAGEAFRLRRVLMRAFYRDDQRVRWSGTEQTFGAEGEVYPAVEWSVADWDFAVDGDFFINLPFESNLLGTVGRSAFARNFEVDPFEVFQLFTRVAYGDVQFTVGKVETPFGRYSFPLFSNSRLDAPFIRTDIVKWTELGAFVRYQPHQIGWLVADLGVVNGTPDLDTNSDKALVGRVGVERPTWAVGLSAKGVGDIGSDEQKVFGNYLGADFRVDLGRFEVSGEVVLDQHGLHRDLRSAGELRSLGRRSLYGQDAFKGRAEPIAGIGYYLNVGYRIDDRWRADANFGSYFPEHIGVPTHDTPVHRGIAKVSYTIVRCFQVFGAVEVENQRLHERAIQNSDPYVLLIGLQFAR
jgi:hypothetical protein